MRIVSVASPTPVLLLSLAPLAPNASHSIAESVPSFSLSMPQRIRRAGRLRRHFDITEPQEVELDRETLERLRELGYVQ